MAICLCAPQGSGKLPQIYFVYPVAGMSWYFWRAIEETCVGGT
jgi:hypothetical protein